MKILNTREEGDHFWLTIQSDDKSFESAYLKHFSGVSRNVSVPGFRKGHAPLDMVISYIKNRGRLGQEYEKIANKLIDKISESLLESHEDLKDKIYSLALDRKLNEFDSNKWVFIFEAKFEKVPTVILYDYSSLTTWIEHKEFDVTKCPVTKSSEATDKDLVAVSLLTKNSKGEVLYQYTYDVIEIDLEITKVRREIVDAIIGSKSRDKKEVTFFKDNEELKTEIIVLEVKEKKDINEDLKKELNVPESTTLEQMQEIMRKQHDVHNSFVRYQDIVKWLLSDANVVKPLPVENLRFEARNTYRSLIKKGNTRVSFETVLFDHTKSFKSSMVLDAIVKKENFSFSEEDKAAFLKDLDEQPWLYGYRKSEELFNESPSSMQEYVLQFKALRLLADRWSFSN